MWWQDPYEFCKCDKRQVELSAFLSSDILARIARNEKVICILICRKDGILKLRESGWQDAHLPKIKLSSALFWGWKSWGIKKHETIEFGSQFGEPCLFSSASFFAPFLQLSLLFERNTPFPGASNLHLAEYYNAIHLYLVSWKYVQFRFVCFTLCPKFNNWVRIKTFVIWIVKLADSMLVV